MATLVFLKRFFDKLKKNPKNHSFVKEKVGTVVRNTFVGLHKTSKALQSGDKFNLLLCLERKVFSQKELQTFSQISTADLLTVLGIPHPP